jgi:hypothetical protein
MVQLTKSLSAYEANVILIMVVLFTETYELRRTYFKYCRFVSLNQITMSENGRDENRNSNLKIDYVTLATMFVQIKAFNEVILKNQAAILAKLNNQDQNELYNTFKETINKEVVDTLTVLQ